MTPTNRRYKLLRDFEHPFGWMAKGLIKTEEEWRAMFPWANNYPFLKDWVEEVSDKKFTQSDLDAAREDAFIAARTYPDNIHCDYNGKSPHERMKYPTLQDYINSLQPKLPPVSNDKDYEILEWVTPNGFVHQKDYSNHTCEENNCEPNSVKRLSDAEVFTVGDKVVWEWDASIYSFFTISGFHIDEAEDLMFQTKEAYKYSFSMASKKDGNYIAIVR